MYQKVTLYRWPFSQNCLGCRHGAQMADNSDMVCQQASTKNDGSYCPLFERNDSSDAAKDKEEGERC